MAKDKLYAIVDIETTGGFASKNRITEIAIIIHNGNEIVEEYQSLVNPRVPIPPKIQYLTGITNEMVADAPSFDEIAPEVYNLLKDKVFVAHNVNFDFSFIEFHFKECNLSFNPTKLCTVRLSRQIFPGHHSYSLGNLCSDLQIPLFDRHRAYGDVLATSKLFTLLIQNDAQNLIDFQMKKNALPQRFPIHLDIQTFENLPQSIGVYLFKNKEDKIVYVGKAINIKSRVNQHFTGKNYGKRRQDFLNEIYSIDFLETGTELMALLYECKLIKHHWPKFNRALKQFEPKFDLIEYSDQNNLQRLAIVKHHKNNRPIKTYERVFDATEELLHIIEKFELNILYCRFLNQEKFDQDIIHRLVEQNEKISVSEYNHKVFLAIYYLQKNNNSYYILDKGRNLEEKSYVFVQNNAVKSFGFVDVNLSFQSIEEVIKNEDLVASNYYMIQLVESFIEKNKMVRFELKSFDNVG